ncbi:MAG: hypothetical protein ISP94_00305 [SAR86 cluster bacterium]|nr:hypothetical protein [SAR86 cluster bacterium]
MKVRSNGSSVNLLLYFFLFIAFVAPRGFGINVLGSVIDITEVTFIGAFALILSRISISKTSEQLFLTTLVLIPIIGVLLNSFETLLPISRFVFYFFLVISGYLIGRFLFSNTLGENNFYLIVQTIIFFNLFMLLVGLINHFFNIVNFDQFRAYDESNLVNLGSLQRMIDGYLGFYAFRGNQLASNEFAILQSSLFAMSLSYYYLNFKYLTKQAIPLLILSIIVSFACIILSQSRGVIVIAVILLLSFHFYGIRKKIGISRQPLNFLAALIAFFSIYFYDQLLFVLTNITTILNYVGLEGINGAVVNSFETSKRIIALRSFADIVIEYPYFLIYGFGEGFWNYHPLDKITIFSDSGFFITYLMEFGLISSIIFIAYSYKILLNVIKLKKVALTVFFFSFAVLLICMQITSFKTNQWYLYFFLGICSFLSSYYESRYNHNSIP